MKFLIKDCNHYEFASATLCEGLKELGHEVYCYAKTINNYKEPYDGQVIDYFIDRRNIRKRTAIIFSNRSYFVLSFCSKLNRFF